MIRRSFKTVSLLAVGAVVALTFTGAAVAGKPAVFSHKDLAIRGYDPVAYFEAGEPTKGDKQFAHEWNGATWLFANSANRDRFAEAPENFAPQYGGYCAWAVSQGYTASIDPDAWTIVDDKLYLNYSKRVEAKWLKDRDNFITAADNNWPKVLE